MCVLGTVTSLIIMYPGPRVHVFHFRIIQPLIRAIFNLICCFLYHWVKSEIFMPKHPAKPPIYELFLLIF
jgi:multisubunit Na+/H+ antiporter MnhE subunit